MTIKQGTRYAREIADGKDYGYSQGTGPRDGRWSGLKFRPGNFDCSSSCGAIALHSGFLSEKDLKGTWYSGNIIKRLVATGMYTAIDVRGRSIADLSAKLRQGDILRGEGHVVYALGGGKIVSFEQSEKGTHFGKVGDQTGLEGRIRDLYPRSRGWSHIARPISAETFLARVIADYAKGRPMARNLDLLARRAPWDGPRWKWFMEQWSRIDTGLPMNLSIDGISAGSLVDHTFVVLGAGLHDDGSMTKKLERRLQLALEGLHKFSNAKVLISGGKARGGITEATAGYNWLVKHGIDPARITREERSSSTIGNARYSLPILAKRGGTYSIVSDASHVRRAQIEFLAAQVELETKTNKVMNLVAMKPLAFNDYAPRAVVTTGPASTQTRLTVATEVAALLGILTQFKAAL